METATKSMNSTAESIRKLKTYNSTIKWMLDETVWEIESKIEQTRELEEIIISVKNPYLKDVLIKLTQKWDRELRSKFESLSEMCERKK